MGGSHKGFVSLVGRGCPMGQAVLCEVERSYLGRGEGSNPCLGSLAQPL